ncbi:hypothetical protein Hdeb2414_s0014g00422361 [Helianthus debilis subsp. tardiflorus]
MCVFSYSLSPSLLSLYLSPRRGTLSPPLSLTPRRGTFSSAMDASIRRHSSSPPALPDLAAVIHRRYEHESSSSESEMLSHSFYAGESSEVRLHPIGNSAKMNLIELMCTYICGLIYVFVVSGVLIGDLVACFVELT